MKKVDVVQYDPNWINQYSDLSEKIKKVLKDNLLNIYHIGSTSVPGMAAKPKIDIVGEVKFGKKTIKPLKGIGFEYRGEWNIPMKFGFSLRDDIHCNLHIYEENHPEIELNIRFCDYLRSHPESVKKYSDLKYEIIDNPDSHNLDHALLRNYTLKKHNFINEIIKKSGFNKLRVVYCTHYHEWEFIKKYDEYYIYDKNNSKKHKYFILYKGVEIVGCCSLEFLSEKEFPIKLIFSKETNDDLYRTYFIGFLENL